MTKKLTVQIAETGTFIGSSLDNQPKKEVIDLQSLNKIKQNFLGNVEVNIEHNKSNVIGYLNNLQMSGNKLLGTMVIPSDKLDDVKGKYISPEFILDDGKPTRLMAVGVVKNPAIDNAKIM